MNDPIRVRALLSMQRALLGMVTPSLRGVAVSWDAGLVAARFVDEHETGNEPELVAEIEAQVLADFDHVETGFTMEYSGAAGPLVLGPGEVWVYVRRES